MNARTNACSRQSMRFAWNCVSAQTIRRTNFNTNVCVYRLQFALMLYLIEILLNSVMFTHRTRPSSQCTYEAKLHAPNIIIISIHTHTHATYAPIPHFLLRSLVLAFTVLCWCIVCSFCIKLKYINSSKSTSNVFKQFQWIQGGGIHKKTECNTCACVCVWDEGITNETDIEQRKQNSHCI